MSEEWDNEDMAHPLEIRERAVLAVNEKGRDKAEVVTILGISLASLNRWLKQYREQGHLKIGHSPGAPSKLTQAGVQALEEQVKAHPEATLAERCSLLAEQGYAQLSCSSMQRMLARLRLTRKKNVLPSPTR